MAIIKYKIPERLQSFIIYLAIQILNLFLIIVNKGDISPYKAFTTGINFAIKIRQPFIKYCDGKAQAEAKLQKWT